MQVHILFISILIGIFLQTNCILLANYKIFREWKVLKTLATYTTPTVLSFNIITLGATFGGDVGMGIGIAIAILNTCLTYLLLVHFDDIDKK